MMDKLEMAKNLLNQSNYSNPGQTTTAYGVASTDSSNGLVMVDMGGDTVSPDDDQSIECETTFKIYEGDEVIVSLIGADGSGKIPIVIGVVGRGDETQAEIDDIKNYFWTDDHGAHVSTVENSVEGANVLLDSDSLDIRVGRSNNHDDQNVVARFGRNSAFIAGVDGTKYWQVKDLRNVSTKIAQIVDVFNGDGTSFIHQTNFFLKSVINVTQNDKQLIEGSDYIVDFESSSINYTAPIPMGSFNEISYLTHDGVFEYDEGIRKGISGPYSKVIGFKNVASGPYSEAHGYLTEANGIGSSSEGYMTKANGRFQKVFGMANSLDNENKYVAIIGNGTIDDVKGTETVSLLNNELNVRLSRRITAVNKVRLIGSSIDIEKYASSIEVKSGSFVDSILTGGRYSYAAVLNLTRSFDYDLLIGIDGNNLGRYSILKKGNNKVIIAYLYKNSFDTNLENYKFVADFDSHYVFDGFHSKLIFPEISDGCEIDENDSSMLSLTNEIRYWCELFTGMSIRVEYTYGDTVRSNAYEFDWNGNANFQGELYLGGCDLNKENPYPALRYNTDANFIEYYNKKYSEWQVPGIISRLYAGKLIGDTTGIIRYLPAGTLCMLVTDEYNRTTFAYRGHRAYLLRSPQPIMFRYQAISQAGLAAGGNAGVTVTRPADGWLEIKCSSTAYTVDYAIYQLTEHRFDQFYDTSIVNNGRINKKFLESWIHESYDSYGKYYHCLIRMDGVSDGIYTPVHLRFSNSITFYSDVIICNSFHAELRVHQIYKAETSKTTYFYIGFTKSIDPPSDPNAIETSDYFIKFVKVPLTDKSVIKLVDINFTTAEVREFKEAYLTIYYDSSISIGYIDVYSMGLNRQRK